MGKAFSLRNAGQRKGWHLLLAQVAEVIVRDLCSYNLVHCQSMWTLPIVIIAPGNLIVSVLKK